MQTDLGNSAHLPIVALMPGAHVADTVNVFDLKDREFGLVRPFLLGLGGAVRRDVLSHPHVDAEAAVIVRADGLSKITL